MSDSCIIDDDYDDDNVIYSSQEKLRLPATPVSEPRSKFERSLSLPDNLDDNYDDHHLVSDEPLTGNPSRRSLMDSVNFVVKPKGDSLKRSSWRRDLRGSQRQRHPDEAELIMRRGWFDVRRSIRVKVGTETGNYKTLFTHVPRCTAT